MIPIASLDALTSGDYIFTQWDDGSITIEHVNYANDPTLEHVLLPAEQVIDLLQFLTKITA